MDQNNTADELGLFYVFAHELKNPLSAAKQFVELVEPAGELSERQKHFLSRALINMERMEQIIFELLDYARLDTENENSFEECDLKSVIRRAATIMQDLANHRNITMQLHIAPDLVPVAGEARLLNHVFVNLVSNAVKYNKRNGRITIQAFNEGDFVRVEVIDTGIGIPADKLPYVFDRFYRVGDKRNANVEGTGLGLAIVKAIVEKHGGRVNAESQIGQGSRFIVIVPHTTAKATRHFDEIGDVREDMDAVDDNLQESGERREADSGSEDI